MERSIERFAGEEGERSRNSPLGQRPLEKDSNWRWSSLLPQLMSPIGPLLALPGMTDAWYVKEDDAGKIIKTKPDSTAVLGVGATVFALTLLSSFSLLLRLRNRHLRFFTLLTLFMLVSHSLLLFVFDTILAVSQSERVNDGFKLSTAFYMSVGAACSAAFVSILLLLDGFRTTWWRKGETGLSLKQNGLVLSFNVFVGILLIATVMFRHLLPPAEDSSYLDSLYYSLQGSTTVGYGSPSPLSSSSRLATVLFFPFAIVSFACLIGFTVTTVIEGLQKAYEKRERAILSRIKADASQDGQQFSLSGSIVALYTTNRRHSRAQLVVAMTLVATVLFAGSAVFSYLENWSFGVALYFSLISAYTIGFGDVLIQTQAGKAFWCVWILFSAASVTILFSVLGDRFSSKLARALANNFDSRFRKLLGRLHFTRESKNSATSTVATQQVSPDLPTTLPILNRVLSVDSDQPLSKQPEKRLTETEELVKLVKELRDQFRGTLGEEVKMKEFVSTKMDEEKFDEKTRALVEADQNLQELVYRKGLQASLERIEALVLKIHEHSTAGS